MKNVGEKEEKKEERQAEQTNQQETENKLPEDKLSEETPKSGQTFRGWLETLGNDETRRLYRDVILTACKLHKCKLSALTPKQWLHFVNRYIPEQITKGQMSVSTSRVYYYAVCSYLTYYRMEHPDFPDLVQDGFLSPAAAVLPDTRRLPTAEQMSALLQYAGQVDPQMQLILVLVFECALSMQEIRELKISDIRETDSGTYYLLIRGKRERKIEIREDVRRKIETYLAVGGYPVEDCLFCYPKKSEACSPRYLQKRLKELQEPLVEKGLLPNTYSLSTIRTAAIHRLIAADSAGCIEAAKYVGIRPDYVARIRSVSQPDLCELPGERKRVTLEELLLEE